MARSTNVRPPTMTDVAKLAGVSQTTVSFVLNNRDDIRIADETKERIREAIEELGYRPNVTAQSLRTNRTNLIGLISDEIVTTPHAGQIILGAQNVAMARGKLLLLMNTDRQEDIKQAAVRMMLDRQVEGIIYATMYHRPVHPPAALREAPAVLLDCFVEDRSLPSVVPDETRGGYTAVEHLILKGHRRIGFINNIDAIPATFGRLQGYKQALTDYGLSFDGDMLLADTSDSGGGYRGTTALLQQSHPPTAIFCFNDRMAMGAYDAIRKLGLSIPNDIAVVGFDNEELIAAHLYPPLSTVQLPHFEMGEWAVNYLLDHAGKSLDDAPIQHVVECPLIERSSV